MLTLGVNPSPTHSHSHHELLGLADVEVEPPETGGVIKKQEPEVKPPRCGAKRESVDPAAWHVLLFTDSETHKSQS